MKDTLAKEVARAIDYIHAARDHRGKNGLVNMERLCALLGNPERGLRAIHVAGTNGKGSVCALLDAVLRAAGYRVGLYTSPFLQRYAERIRIGGAPIADAAFLSAFGPVRAAAERLRAEGVNPTPFELGTALAFVAFAQAGIDLCVIEVGLGGRLDPTNVLAPLVCAITAIALDHQSLLGDTLAAIAGEKAGIIKPGVPVITAAQSSPDVNEVFAACAGQVGAPWYPLTGNEMTPAGSARSLPPQHAAFSYDGWTLPQVHLNLAGAHQLHNAAVALAVIARLREAGLAVPDRAACAGLESVRWPGRLEYVPGRPGILLDVAHNAQSARALADFADTPRALPDTPRVLLCGMLAEKISPDMADALAGLAPRAVTVAPAGRRSLPPEELAALLAGRGIHAQPSADARAALAEARRLAAPAGTVIVAGSLYLVGEVRALLCAEGAIADEP
ncbi:MAG: bifunctional folylpolyglutamate synthase/dihydrofolate synthase [Clostridia bacterium]|nr:bifunctional folylpolyglutamate synthase/dihydrofolate synthase [Clostridia bacterium]